MRHLSLRFWKKLIDFTKCWNAPIKVGIGFGRFGNLIKEVYIPPPANKVKKINKYRITDQNSIVWLSIICSPIQTDMNTVIIVILNTIPKDLIWADNKATLFDGSAVPIKA